MMHQLPVRQGPMYAPVQHLVLYLTEDCNLRCTYCFVKKQPRRMSSETARKAVDWFLSPDISGLEGIVHIDFFGGEPFLELDRMEEIVALAREKGRAAGKRVRFAATTNGTVATPRVERLLKAAEMELLVSLDGVPPANADRPFISGKDSYPVVARNLPKLVEWAQSVVVRMTFTPATLNFVENVTHALSLGAQAVALCPVLESDWNHHEDELNQAYQGLASWFIHQVRAGCLPPLDITWAHLWRLDQALRFGRPRPDRPCPVGASLLAIEPDGNVMPCHRFLYRPQDWLGTVDSTELSHERWKYVHLSSRDILGCDTCPAQTVCGGGCRVVALNSRRHLHDAYPNFCITMRAHARAVERIYQQLTQEQHPQFWEALDTHELASGPLAELAQTG